MNKKTDIKIDHKLYSKFETYCRIKHLSTTNILNQLIREYLDKNCDIVIITTKSND